MRRKIDEQAFIAAYDEYAEAIFRYCYFRIYDRERARELMQETFTKAWEYLQKGNEIENLRAFLYKVAHNVCVNEAIRSKPYSLEEMQEKIGYDPADEDMSSPERDAETALLMTRLGELRPKDREVLTLRYLNGLPVTEIAEASGEAPNTVTVRIRRALDELRKKMEM